MSNKAAEEHPRKILIIKPSSLGDVVHSLPFLNVINKRFPKSEIHWIIARGIEGLLEDNPMIQKLIVIDKDNWKKMRRLTETIKELYSIYNLLRKEQYDLVVDLQGLFRSGILAAATGAPCRVGFKDSKEGSSMFYTYSIEGGRNIHAVDRYLKIADFLGCDIQDVCFPLPLLSVASHESPYFSADNDYAVLAPGARKPANRWSSKKFGQLAAQLPMETLVIGSEDDIELADDVVKASNGNAVSIAGKTDIKGLVEIIKHSKFMVCNDTGPMHIAAALGIQVFAIFGPANPVRTGPYGKNNIVIRKEIECSPCYKKKCNNTKCLDMITVEEVTGVIKKWLNSAAKKKKTI